MPSGGIRGSTYVQHMKYGHPARKSFRAKPACTSLIRDRKKSRKKERPANEVSEDDINALLDAIKSFEGYPKLKDLGRILPSLTPLQVNVIIRYLERSGAIVIDTEGYITWARKEEADQLTLGEVANISSEFRKYLEQQGQDG